MSAPSASRSCASRTPSRTAPSPCSWSLAGCARTPEPAADLDAIARDYLLLQLTIGEKEAGYIDAYYGPPEIQARAKKDKGTIPELRREADRLIAAVRAVDASSLKHLEKKRRRMSGGTSASMLAG